jgi:hypothetical protein
MNQPALEHPVGSDRLYGIKRYNIAPDGIILGRHATKLPRWRRALGDIQEG